MKSSFIYDLAFNKKAPTPKIEILRAEAYTSAVPPQFTVTVTCPALSGTALCDTLSF